MMARARFLTAGLLIIAVAVIGTVLALTEGDRRAGAHAPHEGLDFSIGIDADGDGVDDCDTSGGATSCHVASGSLTVSVYLNSGVGLSYQGLWMVLDYEGIRDSMAPQTVWPHCDRGPVGGFGQQPLSFGCENQGSGTSVYVGEVGRASFICLSSAGSVSLLHGADGYDGTHLIDAAGTEHAEDGSEGLTIECGATPTRIPTRTPTPSPTPCAPSCPPLDFALGIDVDGDGTNDCGTGAPLAVGDGAPDAVPVEVSNTTCEAAADSELVVRSYLMSSGGIPYGAAASHIYYNGVVSTGNGTTHWQCHLFDVTGSGSNFEAAASAHGFKPPICAVGQTNLGLMNRFTFTCSDGGMIALGHGPAETSLASEDLLKHREAGPDKLLVTCGDRTPAPPLPSPSPTPTETPRPTATACPKCPSLQFAIGIDVNGDGTNDCGTGVPRDVGDGAPDAVPIQVTNTACSAVQGRALAVGVYVIDNAGIAYEAQASHVLYSGVTSDGRGEALWEGCVFEATAQGAGFENVGCAIGVAPAAGVRHLGLMTQFTLMCSENGSVSLDHGAGATHLLVATSGEIRERGSGDALTVSCTTAAAGDADCNGILNSIDAALVLQYSAGFMMTLPCEAAADVTGDGMIDSRDAALILQYNAGLCHLLDVC